MDVPIPEAVHRALVVLGEGGDDGGLLRPRLRLRHRGWTLADVDTARVGAHRPQVSWQTQVRNIDAMFAFSNHVYTN